jgi:Tfp pilus assembly protein PilN
MKSIQANFAPRTLNSVIASLLPLQWLALCLSLAIGVAGWVALENTSRSHKLRQAKLQRDRIQAEVKVVTVAETSPILITELQASAVNAAIAQLNLPWSQLLAALEHATPGSIAMLELQPDAKKHLLKGMAETDAPEKMFAYIQRLKNEPFLINVTLLQHEISEQGAIRQVRFVFNAEWREVEP